MALVFYGGCCEHYEFKWRKSSPFSTQSWPFIHLSGAHCVHKPCQRLGAVQQQQLAIECWDEDCWDEGKTELGSQVVANWPVTDRQFNLTSLYSQAGSTKDPHVSLASFINSFGSSPTPLTY